MHTRQSSVLFLSKLCCVLIYVWSPCNGEYVGDSCSVARTGARGTCKLLNDCPAAIDDIIKFSRQPTSCGFVGFQQIVCCPNPIVIRTTTPPPKPTRISQLKCAEYREVLTEKYSLAVGFGEEPIIKEVFKCDISTVSLVVGGEDAKPREFPHMALIGYQDGNTISWSCGGTLISDEFVLTAAHCLYANRQLGYAAYVKLGDLVVDSDSDDSQPIQVNITERIKNPNFKSPSKYHDIALLRLDRKITFNRYVRPACLADRYVPHTSNAIATGWGLTEYHGKRSQILQKVVLEIFTYSECNMTYIYDINRTLRDGIIDSMQICAGSHDKVRDTCQGDSGGPLQVYHPYLTCMYEIVGITSFGKGCGHVSTPGVYTRVFPYLDWIEGIVWPNQ